MLVLLIMFIITVPSQSHQVEVALPQPGGVVIERLKNDVGLTAAGQLSWNGLPIMRCSTVWGLGRGSFFAHASRQFHFRPDAAARLRARRPSPRDRCAQRCVDLRLSGNEQYRDSF
jgi:biopolymer transport protein ExbD